MRFEAKHHYFNYLAKLLGNFKNIPKLLRTVARGICSYILANPSAYLVDTVDSGPGNCYTVPFAKMQVYQ